uniref:Lipoprotein n=1 Tax=Aliivibrio phage vB_Alvi_H905 TaxID=3234039 RepID=A0AB39CA02_9VIRU
MSLFGCASNELPPPVKTEIIYRYPPDSLTVGCFIPPFVGDDLPALSIDNDNLMDVIDNCDLRFKAIRAWKENHIKSTQFEPKQ